MQSAPDRHANIAPKPVMLATTLLGDKSQGVKTHIGAA